MLRDFGPDSRVPSRRIITRYYLSDVSQPVAQLDQMRVDIAAQDSDFGVVLLGTDTDTGYGFRVPETNKKWFNMTSF